jgi:hypothetical protein
MRLTSDESIAVLGRALRTIRQREKDESTVLALALDRRVASIKRIEAAKCILLDTHQSQDRSTAINVLRLMAYRGRRRDSTRVMAMNTLAEVAPSERAWAILHLSQVVETVSSDATRTIAIRILISLGEVGAAMGAMTRRVVDPMRSLAEREQTVFMAATILESVEGNSDSNAGDPGALPSEVATSNVWTHAIDIGRKGLDVPRSRFLSSIGEILRVSAAMDLRVGSESLLTLMHDRAFTWSERAGVVRNLGAGKGARRELSLLGLDELLRDYREPPYTRIARWWIIRRIVDPASNESSLHLVVRDSFAPIDDRIAALMVADAHVIGTGWLLDTARNIVVDGEQPIKLRLAALATLRRRVDLHDPASARLAEQANELLADPRVSRWDRLTWRIRDLLPRSLETWAYPGQVRMIAIPRPRRPR